MRAKLVFALVFVLVFSGSAGAVVDVGATNGSAIVFYRNNATLEQSCQGTLPRVTGQTVSAAIAQLEALTPAQWAIAQDALCRGYVAGAADLQVAGGATTLPIGVTARGVLWPLITQYEAADTAASVDVAAGLIALALANTLPFVSEPPGIVPVTLQTVSSFVSTCSASYPFASAPYAYCNGYIEGEVDAMQWLGGSCMPPGATVRGGYGVPAILPLIRNELAAHPAKWTPNTNAAYLVSTVLLSAYPCGG